MYNILTEFMVSIKIVRLIKMRSSETYSEVRVGKHMSDIFYIQNDLRVGDTLQPLLFIFASESPGRPGGIEIKWDTSLSCLCTCYLVTRMQDKIMT
jgi:hypothetical protein